MFVHDCACRQLGGLSLFWQVFLAPNYKALVSRSAYQDPVHPGLTFVDLVEIRGADKYTF